MYIWTLAGSHHQTHLTIFHSPLSSRQMKKEMARAADGRPFKQHHPKKSPNVDPRVYQPVFLGVVVDPKNHPSPITHRSSSERSTLSKQASWRRTSTCGSRKPWQKLNYTVERAFSRTAPPRLFANKKTKTWLCSSSVEPWSTHMIDSFWATFLDLGSNQNVLVSNECLGSLSCKPLIKNVFFYWGEKRYTVWLYDPPWVISLVWWTPRPLTSSADNELESISSLYSLKG